MVCDKCGKEVPTDNDATIIEAIAFNRPEIILENQSRHFLPVIGENGEVLCEGSPSRAQYIEGQPPDKRGYSYYCNYERLWREAYQQAQGQNVLVSLYQF